MFKKKKKERAHNFHSLPLNVKLDRPRNLGQPARFQIRNKVIHIHIFHSLPSNAKPDRARKLEQQAIFQIRNK
jgi:hypothetical protein